MSQLLLVQRTYLLCIGCGSMNIIFSNRSDKEIKINLEPWAETYTLRHNDNIQLNISFSAGDDIHIEYRGLDITYDLPSGSRAKVLINGDDKTRSSWKFESP